MHVCKGPEYDGQNGPSRPGQVVCRAGALELQQRGDWRVMVNTSSDHQSEEPGRVRESVGGALPGWREGQKEGARNIGE